MKLLIWLLELGWIRLLRLRDCCLSAESQTAPSGPERVSPNCHTASVFPFPSVKLLTTSLFLSLAVRLYSADHFQYISFHYQTR